MTKFIINKRGDAEKTDFSFIQTDANIVNKHLMTGPKGNSEFCFPETLNVPPRGTMRTIMRYFNFNPIISVIMERWHQHYFHRRVEIKILDCLPLFYFLLL